MAGDRSEALRLPVTQATSTQAQRPSRLEGEVVALFDQFRHPVVRYLLSFGLSSADADEIAQDVFLALFEHLSHGKDRSNLPAWIFRVAHNLALKQRVRLRRESERYREGPEPVAAANPEEQAQSAEHRGRLLSVVRALPEQDQYCLSLRAEGLRYREIAEVLGISLGSVANSLERSLSRLKRALER